jgi:septal ring factor EnvC (AmiA/AmiB activator)
MEQEETQQEQKQDEEKAVETAAAVTQHFDKSSAVWPIEGDVLLDYSMDSTIYFPTLEQYRCNPAMVISGKVNDKVFAMAKGKITDIQENEETGCTVIQDLGDGYAAVYGQLKELNFAKGDTPEAGQVLGYVSEPTKYYTTEGSNVYFQLKKDGKAVDPKEYLPQMAMDTLD